MRLTFPVRPTLEPALSVALVIDRELRKISKAGVIVSTLEDFPPLGLADLSPGPTNEMEESE